MLDLWETWKPGVDFINGFAPLGPTFAPCAQLLRSFLLVQKFGERRESLGKGLQQFMKSTPDKYNMRENKNLKLLIIILALKS